MELEAANLMMLKAATLYDGGEACGAEANTAKYLAGEAGYRACETAVMTHGGMGYAKEFHVERYLRESLIPRIAPVSPELDPVLRRRARARLAEVLLVGVRFARLRLCDSGTGLIKPASLQAWTPKLTTARFFAALLAGMCAASAFGADGQVIRTDEHALRVRVITQGLEHPWGLAFLPDGRMLVTERAGRLRSVRDGKLDPLPIAGLPPIAAAGQGGLMDVALHPRYADNGWIYISYAARGPDGVGTEVLRARLKDDRLSDVQVIFRMQPKKGGGCISAPASCSTGRACCS